jgi:hypothetical protein
MKAQQETETKIIEYFRKHIETGIKIENDKYYSDLIKIPFEYIDFNKPLTFTPNPIDFAIYSIKEKKVIYIEYPWRKKNKELTYNKIYL